MPAPADATRRASILIADDEPAVLQVLTQMLQGAGFTVFGAPDREQALKVLQAHPDVVALIDLKLAGDDGLSLLREMRRAVPSLCCCVTFPGTSGTSPHCGFGPDKGAGRRST